MTTTLRVARRSTLAASTTSRRRRSSSLLVAGLTATAVTGCGFGSGPLTAGRLEPGPHIVPDPSFSPGSPRLAVDGDHVPDETPPTQLDPTADPSTSPVSSEAVALLDHGRRLDLAPGDIVVLPSGEVLEYVRTVSDTRCAPMSECLGSGSIVVEFTVGTSEPRTFSMEHVVEGVNRTAIVVDGTKAHRLHLDAKPYNDPTISLTLQTL